MRRPIKPRQAPHPQIPSLRRRSSTPLNTPSANMILHFDALPDLRLPDYPDARLVLDGHPLSIFKENSFSAELEKIPKPASVPHGIATILYRWNPNALVAFLDLDAWFSLTWTVTLPPSTPNAAAKKLEIGRVGGQITFGTLDSSGENWEVMLTYNVALASDEKFKRGQWVPNTKESMLGEKDVKIAELVERLGDRWTQDAMKNKSWEAGKGVKHTFHVEYAPMDIFGDGIAMSPHLLYQSLDLARCTACNASSDAKPLNRCGRCGTAAYCSAECQKDDWRVHKWVCTMSVEDRGMAIKVSEKGGLYKWDTERTMVAKGEEVESENPFFETVQYKRTRDE
ncbi:hypothetical protein OPT61_g4805 [Boeremia exigua]|uniref:Uncharacterized protein n=1 Tax=Boeremia exigua TaxID=749465 RepID=A0ACC2ICY4_9PLEO|nr:hypothetical protein OPT61_g4805 [Boeremia exigua]